MSAGEPASGDDVAEDLVRAAEQVAMIRKAAADNGFEIKTAVTVSISVGGRPWCRECGAGFGHRRDCSMCPRPGS